MSKYLTPVIVGRFQTPYLHEGHRYLIDQAFEIAAKDNRDKVLIFIGTSQIKNSERDPLDYKTRELMLRQAYPSATIREVKDCPTNEEWCDNLDAMIDSILNPLDLPLMMGGRDSFLKVYNSYGKYSKSYLNLSGQGPEASATDIRKETKEKVLSSNDFRAGVIYAALNKYPAAVPVIDIIVYSPEHKKFLVGKKRKEDERYVFPGGFVDPTDFSYENAALRELYEETGLKPIVEEVKYLGSFRMNDWRFIGRKDMSMFTTLFMIKYDGELSDAKASDDLVEVTWLSAEELEKNIMPIHKQLFNRAISAI